MSNPLHALRRMPPVEALCAILYALLGSIGVFSGGLWAGIGIGGAILMAFFVAFRHKSVPKPDKRALLWVVFVLLWAFLSSLWSVDVPQTLHQAGKLATILLPLLLLFAPQIRREAQGIIVHAPLMIRLITISLFLMSGFIIVLSLIYEYNAPQVAKLNRGFSYTLLLLWPVLAVLSEKEREWRRIWPLFGAIALAFCLTRSSTAQLSLIVAGAVFLVARLWPHLVIGALGVGAMLALVWPAASRVAFENLANFQQYMPKSWVHRVEIWDYLAARIAERPLLGWGLGSLPKLDWTVPHGTLYNLVAGPAAHAHNAVMQLWVEMGVLGLVLYLLGALGTLYLVATRLPARARPYGLACWSMALTLLLCAYHPWTDSLWAAISLTGFGFTLSTPQELSHS